jgi:hypothetical protein
MSEGDNMFRPLSPGHHKVIIYNICNFVFLKFYTGVDTTLQNNDNYISLRFKLMRIIFMNYSV